MMIEGNDEKEIFSLKNEHFYIEYEILFSEIDKKRSWTCKNAIKIIYACDDVKSERKIMNRKKIISLEPLLWIVKEKDPEE